MSNSLPFSNLFKKALFFFASFLFSLNLWAQGEPAMATGLRSSGKIYVVVAVLAIIFAGIVVYLISIDKKMSRLEQQVKEHQK